jgi:hypothetical protein
MVGKPKCLAVLRLLGIHPQNLPLNWDRVGTDRHLVEDARPKLRDPSDEAAANLFRHRIGELCRIDFSAKFVGGSFGKFEG